MPRNNKDKTPVDESILDETPPNINEPQDKNKPEDEESTEIKDEKNDVLEREDEVDEGKNDEETGDETPEEKPEKPTKKITPEETQEDKDRRYKAQQTEAQIQAAKNRNLINKVDEAAAIGDPTVEDLTKFVAQDGVTWDELTVFEQSMAKKSYLAEKRFDLVNQAVQSTKEIDRWAGEVDEFIDKTDGKPEFIKLSGHEADFRKFSMQESHRGTPIDVLLGSFLYNLPKVEKKRGKLFENSGGGEKPNNPNVITDTDEAANLRATNPREYRRQVKAGRIKLEA